MHCTHRGFTEACRAGGGGGGGDSGTIGGRGEERRGGRGGKAGWGCAGRGKKGSGWGWHQGRRGREARQAEQMEREIAGGGGMKGVGGWGYSYHIDGPNTCRDAPANGVAEACCCSSCCCSACCCGWAACWIMGTSPVWTPAAEAGVCCGSLALRCTCWAAAALDWRGDRALGGKGGVAATPVKPCWEW